MGDVAAALEVANEHGLAIEVVYHALLEAASGVAPNEAIRNGLNEWVK